MVSKHHLKIYLNFVLRGRIVDEPIGSYPVQIGSFISSCMYFGIYVKIPIKVTFAFLITRKSITSLYFDIFIFSIDYCTAYKFRLSTISKTFLALNLGEMRKFFLHFIYLEKICLFMNKMISKKHIFLIHVNN